MTASQDYSSASLVLTVPTVFSCTESFSTLGSSRGALCNSEIAASEPALSNCENNVLNCCTNYFGVSCFGSNLFECFDLGTDIRLDVLMHATLLSRKSNIAISSPVFALHISNLDSPSATTIMGELLSFVHWSEIFSCTAKQEPFPVKTNLIWDATDDGRYYADY